MESPFFCVFYPYDLPSGPSDPTSKREGRSPESPEGSCESRTQGGPIVFTYVLIVVLGRYFEVSKIQWKIRLFENLKMLYCDGWVGGLVDGLLVGCDFLPPSIFFILSG